MTSSYRLARLIDRIYKPELDPGRVRRVYREFDIERGYKCYHDVCREQCSRNQTHVAGKLAEQGFEHLSVLDPNQALTLLHRIRSELPLSRIKRDTRHLQGFHVTKGPLLDEILSAVLPTEVDRRLAGLFHSDYLVHWMTVSVTPRGPRQTSVSFRWHCDRGPTAHLKLIVYLNGTEEHGGNTEFISSTDTVRVAARGYLFGRTRKRTGSVARLSRIAGRDIRSYSQPMNPGDGVIFQPAMVLHRGVGPTMAPRYVVTLCLLPSPVPWQQALARGAFSDLAMDEKWYRHATELLTAIDRGGNPEVLQAG